MTGLGLSEKKTVVDSELAVAHLVAAPAECSFWTEQSII